MGLASLAAPPILHAGLHSLWEGFADKAAPPYKAVANKWPI